MGGWAQRVQYRNYCLFSPPPSYVPSSDSLAWIKRKGINYRQLHLPVNALAQNMFSCDVKRLSFRCQTFKFSRPNEKFYFSTLLKGKMILINKKGRNYQKGVPLSTICGVKWKNLRRIILSQKLGEDLGAVSKIVKHYTSH